MKEHLIHGYHQRGYLPHLKHEGVDYFVTFRLADSLPREALTRFEEEIAQMEFPSARAPSEADAERNRERHRRIERWLDQGAGSCCLRDPHVARLVQDALRHFDGQRYALEAWVVMPNHVHALVRPMSGHVLGSIVRSWKQFTSRRGKQVLGLPEGRFWQPESYDHWVRDEEERARILRYIHNNPVKAGLCERPEDWPWSSAGRSANFQSASGLGCRLEVCATPIMLIIANSLASVDLTLPVIELRVDRRTLMKRLWRGIAADGAEFGFELDAPLKHGDTFFQSDVARYVLVQEPEPVLEVLIGDLPASATAGIGWAVGNLHLEFSSEAHRLLTPDEPAARQLFARIQVDYKPTTAVFRPGRFKRSVSAPLVDELGPSHKH